MSFQKPGDYFLCSCKWRQNQQQRVGPCHFCSRKPHGLRNRELRSMNGHFSTQIIPVPNHPLIAMSLQPKGHGKLRATNQNVICKSNGCSQIYNEGLDGESTYKSPPADSTQVGLHTENGISLLPIELRQLPFRFAGSMSRHHWASSEETPDGRYWMPPVTQI